MTMTALTNTLPLPSEAAFPQTGTAIDKLRFLVPYALLAPSAYITPSQVFSLRDDSLLLSIDRARSGVVLDPEERELIIGCGAALFFLRLALHHFGYQGDIHLLPASMDRDVMAEIRIGDRHSATATEENLFAHITEQHTDRQPFVKRPVPYNILAHLQTAAEAEGAWLVFADTIPSRMRLAAVVAEGERRLQGNGEYRHHLSLWIDSAFAAMPHLSLLASKRRGTPAGTVAQAVNHMSANTIARQAPVLAVLGTANDTPEDWLKAGHTFAGILLLTSTYGLSASILNQPLAIRELRHIVDSGWAPTGRAQIILRLGYKPSASALRPIPSEPLLIETSKRSRFLPK